VAATTLARTTRNTIVKSTPLAKGESSGVIHVCGRIKSEPVSAIKDLVGQRAEQRAVVGAIGCSGGTDFQEEIARKTGAARINQPPASSK
jgi:hypothetical protein